MFLLSRAVKGPDDYPAGQNRLECAYEFFIERRYFERKDMKRKEVEDVMGGKDAWANVDKTDAQCRRDGFDGPRAFFYQVQIRSADELMTIFYKVRSLWSRKPTCRNSSSDICIEYTVRSKMEGELSVSLEAPRSNHQEHSKPT
ncbi:RNA polymerase III C11 subunit [Sticta canariensis]|nr:RNA polymerase III C11 subunit [Sticta canariensis]